jgi:peptidoglycan/LPS O-acetylase OafA/YrhL
MASGKLLAHRRSSRLSIRERKEVHGDMVAEVTTAIPIRVKIDAGVSSYLDLLRTVAAMTVLLSHYLPVLFGASLELVPGHDAVIIFFVMSGYVIAFVTADRDRPFSKYAIHRLARLWSVLIPALALSAIASVLVGARIGPVPVTIADISAPAAFAGAALENALFMGENWVGATPAPYNAVVWSLNYEAWYYAIFAAFTFAPRQWRWHISGLLLFLAGPNVALLFPCWLLGALLFNYRGRVSLRPATAYLIFAACLVLYGFAYYYNLTTQSRHWLSNITSGESYHLRSSTAFVGDYLLAPLVAASIVAIEHMPAVNRMFVQGSHLTKLASSRTLSIYLFHMPLLAILYGRVGLGHGEFWSGLACLLLGIALSVLLGNVTEARLSSWRRWLARVYRLAAGLMKKWVIPRNA